MLILAGRRGAWDRDNSILFMGTDIYTLSCFQLRDVGDLCENEIFTMYIHSAPFGTLLLSIIF